MSLVDIRPHNHDDEHDADVHLLGMPRTIFGSLHLEGRGSGAAVKRPSAL